LSFTLQTYELNICTYHK